MVEIEIEIVGHGGSLTQLPITISTTCAIVAQTVEVMPSTSVITIVREPEHRQLTGPGSLGESLLTAVQVAELLSVPKTRVWSMSRREIPTVRLGPREVRYRPEDIDNWIARRTTSRPRGTQS
ncbi:MAG: helix-turn-helix transcriptional regulator [Solirubrobacteraceae bacterium]